MQATCLKYKYQKRATFFNISQDLHYLCSEIDFFISISTPKNPQYFKKFC